MNCRICDETNAKYDIYQDEYVFWDESSATLISCLNSFYITQITEPDNKSSYLCETCLIKLVDTYNFLLHIRLTETKDDEKYVEISNAIPGIKDNTSSDLISIEGPGKTLDLIEETIVPPADKKHKREWRIKEVGWNVSMPLNTLLQTLPEYIITAHFYFTLHEIEGRIIKILKTSPRRRYISPDSTFDFSDLDSISIREEDVIIQCQYCEKAFTTEYHALVHFRSTHLCGHCLFCFRKSSDLQVHLRTHNNLTCKFCKEKKTYSQQSNYRKHLLKYHGIQLPQNIYLIDPDCEEALFVPFDYQ